MEQLINFCFCYDVHFPCSFIKEIFRRDWMFKLVGDDIFTLDDMRCVIRVNSVCLLKCLSRRLISHNFPCQRWIPWQVSSTNIHC